MKTYKHHKIWDHIEQRNPFELKLHLGKQVIIDAMYWVTLLGVDVDAMVIWVKYETRNPFEIPYKMVSLHRTVDIVYRELIEETKD